MNFNFLQVLIMAIVQGITEFLPISSSGHLIVVERLLNVDPVSGATLIVMLHVGTLAAIVLAFYKDIKQIMFEVGQILVDVVQNGKLLFHNKREGDALRYQKLLSNNYRKFALLLGVSTVSTAVVAICIQPLVAKTSGSLIATGAGVLITAVVLLVVSFTKNGNKAPLDIDYRIAIVIGVCQGIAVLPGISRAAITIGACLLVGFSCKFAVKYSFILAIPTILGAMFVTLVTIPKESINLRSVFYCVVGMLIAAIVGIICIRVMLKFIKKQNFKFFAGYCLLMGAVTIMYNFI